MSPDISTLVSEYADHVDEIAPPITVEELETMVGRVPLRSVPASARSTSRRGWLVAAAAAVVVLLAGALVVWAQRPGGDQAPVITQPDPVTTTVLPTTTLPATTLPEATPTTVPPPPAVPGGDLSWQRIDFDVNAGVVFDGGDRFVVPVEESDGTVGELRTSFDGVTWTTRPLPTSGTHSWEIKAVWEDALVAVTGGGGISATEDGPISSIPSTVSVLLGDGTANHRVFSADVQAAAIGPAGIVVRASSFLDEETIIHNVLGADFASNLWRTELRDGVLHAETTDGQSADIVLAQHGYDADALGRVDWWYSSDGQEWFPILGFPPVDDVVGTRDGFVGIGLGGMDVWHSIDGRTWQSFGALGFLPDWSPTGLGSRWRDGAILTDGSEFVYVSASGLEVLPAPPGAISTSDSAPWPLVATGEVGIAYVSVRSGESLFSLDGDSWSATTLPTDMADSWGWFTSSAAATDSAVLLLLWDDHGTGGEQEPVWWLGTLG